MPVASYPNRTLLAALLALALTACSATPPPSPDAGTPTPAGDAGAAPAPSLLAANAGDDRVVRPGTLVHLSSATAIAVGATRLSYAWTQVAGPTVTLSDPASRAPRFRAPPESSDLLFRLEVESAGQVETDLVHILVRAEVRDTPPFASAGPDQAVLPGTSLTLSAAASTDLDGDALTYLWRTHEGALAGEGPTLTVQVHDPITHLRLVVSDGLLESKDDVILRATEDPTSLHAPVVAWPEATVVDPGTPLVLWGSVTDPDGDPLRLRWREIDGPAVTLETDSRRARFLTPQQVSRLFFKVDATDGLLESAPVPVIVEVTAGAGNTAPVADAGPDLDVDRGDLVTLDGSASFDPDGEPIAGWEWLQIAGPILPLEASDTPTLTFTAPGEPATLVFTLTVRDLHVSSEPDLVRVEVH
jgi:hypothetical protein